MAFPVIFLLALGAAIATIHPALPAGLSPAVLTLLWDRFQPGGAVVTDSLSVAGVAAGRPSAGLRPDRPPGRGGGAQRLPGLSGSPACA